MSHAAIIDSVLRPLAQSSCQAYLSDKLQVADVLQWILAQTGPADVQLTSFSVSEEFLRRIFFIEKAGMIKSLELVLDFKATNKTLILWPFIEQVVEHCFLAANHSKILLASNDTLKVAVVMSQNLTRGNRHEAALVSTDPAVFDNLHAQVDSLIKNQSVPFHEVFERAVREN